MASPEEQLHKAVSDVLGEIKQEALVTPDNEWILISTHTDERWRAVRYLAKLGSIKAREHTPLGSVSAMKLVQEMNGRVYKPNAYKVEILQPKFDEVYKQYQNPLVNTLENSKPPYKKYITAHTNKERVSETHKIVNTLVENPTSISLKPIRNKLSFFPATGDIEFNTETGVTTNGHKDYALLSFLNQYKNTPFNIQDIRDHCNSLVNNSAHKFKGEKDVDDTLRQIRFKLKIKKGAYFPILKRGEKNNKKWVWVEK